MAIRPITIDSKTFNISYILQNNNKNHWALFLHGWGSNKELMQNCFNHAFENYNHIYIDLPGFGNSSNNYVLDSKEYFKIIKTFLDSLNINPMIIIGHSFGGKIAALLNPNILVLLSSAGIPKIKNNKVKLKIKLAKFFNYFGLESKIFRSKDVLNMNEHMYKTFKLVVNEDFSDIFNNLVNQTFIFWGENDTITPIYMANKINSIIKNSQLYLLEGDHFFFLSNAKKIDRIINGN